MKRPSVLPTLYDALFRVCVMRDAVAALRSDLEEREMFSFLSRLKNAELAALHLIDQVEAEGRVSSH